MAWNAIARSAITADPDWQGGHYYGTGRAPNAGMGVARMVGHITYLSSSRSSDKFGRRLQFADDIRYTLTEPEFEVESYLRYQADAFVKRFDANTYLYTSRALSYFDLARQYGGGRARAGAVRECLGANAAHRVQLRLALSAVRVGGAGGGAARARARRSTLHMIEAPYGHDCFLLEEARQTPMIQAFLAQMPGCEEQASMEESRQFGFETRQVHAGQRPDPNTGARAVPIFQTTSYVFEDPESAAAYFNLQEYGNTYSRIMNPTVAVFEERMANLEGGCGAVAFASGIAAQAAALFTLLTPGDHVVSSSALYGGTVNQLKHLLRKMSVELTWVDPDDPERVEGGGPRQHQGVLRRDHRQPRRQRARHRSGRGHRARARRSRCIVDNTFATPFLCRPIEWGADIVLHSATKFIGGHGTSIGGVVVDSGQFNWSNGRYPVIADPSPAYHGLQFHETFGTYGYLMKLRAETLRDLGAAMSPFNAFLFLQGLETLSLRMARHVENAGAVARYLESHALASNVTYPGLPASRYRPLVEKYLPRGCGRGVLVRLPRRPRRRPGLHPRRDAVVASGQRRRLEEPHHPSRQHDAPSAERGRAPRRRRRPGDDPPVGRHRGRRRSDLGSRTGIRARCARRRRTR